MTVDSSSRRDFLANSAAAVGSASVAGAFGSFLATADDRRQRKTLSYGPLSPVADETTGIKLLQLPKGFRYLSFGWTKDRMSDGIPTPATHDGMGVIAEKNGVVTMCRNHELNGDKKPFAPAEISFDSRGEAGCTMLTFDTSAGKWGKDWSVLSGTSRNCAGGVTNWGSWLTCEETVSGPGFVYKKKRYGFKQHHGWIFEVPADGKADPKPLKDMGRFWHEAIAVDPKTGYVYETEDRKTAGFYRFIPRVKGRLAKGGKLQMLKAEGAPNLRGGSRPGQTYRVSWVDIDDPTGDTLGIFKDGKYDDLAVFKHGKSKGGTTFARLEGCWYGNKQIYLVSTSGGKAKSGQVWAFNPAEQTLTLLFESPDKKVLDKPDNVAVSPRGGLVLCEDGNVKPQRMHGMTPEGRLFPFAANNIRLKGERNGFRGDFLDSEWAGATFSSNGQWLFVNNQRPGITFAITGPWEKGGL